MCYFGDIFSKIIIFTHWFKYSLIAPQPYQRFLYFKINRNRGSVSDSVDQMPRISNYATVSSSLSR